MASATRLGWSDIWICMRDIDTWLAPDVEGTAAEGADGPREAHAGPDPTRGHPPVVLQGVGDDDVSHGRQPHQTDGAAHLDSGDRHQQTHTRAPPTWCTTHQLDHIDSGDRHQQTRTRAPPTWCTTHQLDHICCRISRSFHCLFITNVFCVNRYK